MNTSSSTPASSSTDWNHFDRRGFLKTAALTSSVVAMVAPAPAGGGMVAAPGGGSGSANDAVPLAPPDRQPEDLRLPEVDPRKAGWAIVGLGGLALEQILPAFLECEHSRPVALVSGHLEKARKVADFYGIDPASIYSYENYDELAKNPKVDVIYIVLPNSMHAEFTIRGLRAGKHVLCEKPMAVSVAESEQMIAAAKKAGRQLGVAYRLHYEPNHLKVMELCQQKSYGRIKLFTSNNCQNTTAPNIRLSTSTGGGPVGDLGVYSINAARYCIGEEPVEVTAMAHQPSDDPRFQEVPESVVYTMRFPSGAMAVCECSFGTSADSFFHVICEKATIEMDPAFPYQGQKVKISESSKTTELRSQRVNQFTEEIDDFSQCVLSHRPTRTPGEEGLADMRILAAINEAARTGGTVKVG